MLMFLNIYPNNSHSQILKINGYLELIGKKKIHCFDFNTEGAGAMIQLATRGQLRMQSYFTIGSIKSTIN